MTARLARVLACALAPWAAGAALAQAIDTAALPEGALSVAETKGVEVEVCQDHWLDAGYAVPLLPPGVRLVTAGELAARDRAVRGTLAKHPELSGDAVGSLCFLRALRFEVDGVVANANGPLPMASWRVRVVPTEGESADPRMLGARRFVQLRSWYPNEGVDHTRVLAADPQAEFADVSVEALDPERWSVALAVGDATIRGEVRKQGGRKRKQRSGPSVMTVRNGRPHDSFFTVFVYFGNHERPAVASWEAAGESPLARAIADRARLLGLEPVYQDGWRARSGLYRDEVSKADQTIPPPAP